MSIRQSLLLGCLLAPGALAQDGPRLGPGPLDVVVTASDSGKAVDGAVVRVGERWAATGPGGSVTLDGLPSGEQALRVEHRGFQRLSRSVRLPEGPRERLHLRLTPVVRCDVDVRVRLRRLRRPIAGAGVLLAPVDVLAGVSGPIETLTEVDGSARLRDLPSGRYRLRVRAGNCRDAELELEARPGMPEILVELEDETAAAPLEVRVADAAEGTALAGAVVTLAEARPLGRIAQARTDARGTASFRELRTGHLNWTDADGALPVPSRFVTVRVEREGYEPVLLPADLAGSEPLTVALQSEQGIEEREPNDRFDVAQEIRTGSPVTLRIDRGGDQDVFRFRIAHAAHLEVELGPKPPLATRMVLRREDGTLVKEHAAPAGRANTLACGVKGGVFHLRVRARNEREVSTETMTLRVTRRTAPDALEPNDSPENAHGVATGRELRGCLFPKGDVDCYAFEPERPGTVRFRSSAHPLARRLVVRDGKGAVVAERRVPAGRAAHLDAACGRGRYTLELSAAEATAESMEPYLLELVEFPGEGPQPPGPALSGLAGATLNPAGDIDRYELELPGAGLLFVDILAPIGVEARLLSSEGTALASVRAHPERGGRLRWSASEAARVVVELRARDEKEWSPRAYVLRTWWDVCDDLESPARNETPATATPLVAGDALRGSILPVGDVDFYRLEVSHPATLRMSGSAPVAMTTRIRGADEAVLATRECIAGGTLDLTVDVLPGRHYLEVRARRDDAVHVGAYALHVGLRLAEPVETVPLRDDPPRVLRIGEAQPFRFDHVGDRDRFVVDVPGAAPVTVRIRGSGDTTLRVFHAETDEPVRDERILAGRLRSFELAPARYRFELTESGNERSDRPGYLFVDPDGRRFPLEETDARVDPSDPALVTFSRRVVANSGKVHRVLVDADGDGDTDFELPAAVSKTWRFTAAGLYPAEARLAAEDGASTLVRFWIRAMGPAERPDPR